MRYLENLMIFRKKFVIFRILLRKKYWNHVFLGSYFNANQGMGISVTEIQTNLYIWACCNQMIQQHSPFIIYAMWLMFNKNRWNLCCHFRWLAIFLRVFTVIFMKWNKLFLRYLERFWDILKKNWAFPETYLGDFSWYLYLGLGGSD